ncbi:MAG: GNAT family N-acetyltransferase [Chloroflexota bacterium]|nr:GNAT family N-acetyltransferase [Chloroflexota bacterium]
MVARTPAQRADALRVRIAVFCDEQGIAREDELDALDADAVHVAGYLGPAPVAAGRLVLAEGRAKVGRMAVLREHRGRGYGAAILAALEREAAARGIRDISLSAQLHAAGFYERAGYRRIGDVYDEVGIPHVAMEKRLG